MNVFISLLWEKCLNSTHLHFIKSGLKISVMFIGIISGVLIYSFPAEAQYPFSKRIGFGGLFGHSKLAGDMNKFLQGDLVGGLRIKYNFANKYSFEARLVSQKKFMNRLDFPAIPMLEQFDDVDDVNLSAKFTPVLLNVNYYLSTWDTRPYFTIGLGYYFVSTDVYVSFQDESSSVFNAKNRIIGGNVGFGIETFLGRRFSFEVQAVMHFIPYEPPSSGLELQFPIDNPKYATFAVGFIYYLN